MSDALLITVAPTGAETAKADCPQLPTTPEEIAETAAECEAAGAAMIHLHVRDGEHAPTLDRRSCASGSRRCASRRRWSSSSPPAARSTTRSTSG